MKAGFVALAGRPNAGKSTLLNALIGEKVAIVSPKPSTTRSQIRGILNRPDAQIVFTDTPGIHKPHHLLESRMNKEASGVILGTDVVYLIADGSQPYAAGDAFVLNMVKQAQVPVFLILNKIDLLSRAQVLDNLTSWQKRFAFAEFFPLSAKFQTGFEELISATVNYLPEGPALYPADEVSDEPEDFRIAEIIREKILACTEDEVPHATAVLVESKKIKKESAVIQAVILVEREGQKGILIGRQGRMLKEIGIQARQDLEQLLGRKVYLELFVRVEPEWRDRDSRISQYGYGGQDDEK